MNHTFIAIQKLAQEAIDIEINWLHRVMIQKWNLNFMSM
jgi:hypothetical protein